MTFTSLLIHSVYKQSKVSSQNDLGEWTYTYTTSTSPIICRISPVSNRRYRELQGYMDDVRYQCFMNYSESVSIGDKLVYSGTEYRVKEVILDSNSHHKTALLSVVK